MPRVATWDEVSRAYRAYERLETFRVVEAIAADYFAHEGQRPARVEIELEIGSEYDDESSYFTVVYITSFAVLDAAGARLKPFDPETAAPMSEEDFKDFDLEDRLSGSEWDVRKFFRKEDDLCVVDLLNAPPEPPALLFQDESQPEAAPETCKEDHR